MKKIVVVSILILILTNISNGASPTLIKFVLIGEAPYQKNILISENPNLMENNFMVCPQTMNQAVFLDSVYKKIESYPAHLLPIIMSTYGNFSAINNVVKDSIRFPKRNILNIIISYVGGGIEYPNGYDTNEKIDSCLILVGGGANDTSDWTWGNKLKFITPVKIQYIDGGNNIHKYDIDSIYNQSYPNRIYSSTLSSQAVWGTPVWIKIKNTEGDTIIKRFTIGMDHGGGTYVTTAPINLPGVFLSGTATVNWRSGAVVYIGSKLKKIMDGRHCPFLEAVACAEATASNNGQWIEWNGYGQINVPLAIAYIP
ncbi:MAG TPA: hypothetical protein PK720_01695 [bacterium]|nr:hypothetical protein [bacterium]